jgi:hypothetical protein
MELSRSVPAYVRAIAMPVMRRTRDREQVDITCVRGHAHHPVTVLPLRTGLATGKNDGRPAGSCDGHTIYVRSWALDDGVRTDAARLPGPAGGCRRRGSGQSRDAGSGDASRRMPRVRQRDLGVGGLYPDGHSVTISRYASWVRIETGDAAVTGIHGHSPLGGRRRRADGISAMRIRCGAAPVTRRQGLTRSGAVRRRLVSQSRTASCDGLHSRVCATGGINGERGRMYAPVGI